MSDINTPAEAGEYQDHAGENDSTEATATSTVETAEQPTEELVTRLSRQLTEAIGQATPWYDDMKLADDRRWCIWPGQRNDGTKHGPEKGKPAFPWNGASDTRIRLVDEKVREADRKCAAAFDRGRWKVGGLIGSREQIAGKSTQLLKWMWYCQMEEEADREAKLARDWRNSYGLSFTFIEWHKEDALEAVELDRDKLAAAIGLGPIVEAAGGDMETFLAKAKEQLDQSLPANASPQDQLAHQQMLELYKRVSGTWALLTDSAQEDELVKALQLHFKDVKEARLRKAAKELQKNGTAVFPQPITLINRPRIRALKPFVHVFFPTATTNVANAEWFAVAEFLTETQLREKKRQGWDPACIEAALATKGKRLTTPATAVKGVAVDSVKDLIEVFHFFHRASDEDGVPGLYRLTLSQHVCQDGKPDEKALFFKNELYGPARMKMPFVAHEFFTESERLIDQRGIPYVLHTYQNEKKTARDSRIDLSTISIVPQPVRHVSDMDRPVDVGPQVPIYESVVGSFRWASPPAGRPELGVEIERAIDTDVNRLMGSPDANIPAPLLTLHDDVLTGDYCKEMGRVLSRCLELMQQYMDTVTVTRVTGEFPEPFPMSQDDIRGDFDLRILFDARELDTEFVMKKFEMLGKAAQNDKEGTLDYNQVLALELNAIDPSWADTLIRSSDNAARAEIRAEKDAITDIMTGQQPDMLDSSTHGINWQLRLQTLNDAVSRSPLIQQALKENQVIGKIYQTHLANLEQGITQQKNARIGRTGTAPAI